MDLNRLVDRLDLNSQCELMTLGPDDQVQRISFGEIRRRVDDAMERLRGRGVTPGMRLGLLAENCVEWIVYDLALLTMGCTTVAFPRELTAMGLRAVFDRFDLSLMLLSVEETLPLGGLKGRVHFIDGDTPFTEPALPSRKPTAPEDFTPTLIFSSGSSGKTKCLVCDLDGVAFDIEQFYKLFDIGAADRLLIFLPFNHFQQRVCVYAAVWYGVEIALVRPHQVFDAFQRLAPTLCLAPPVLYETIYTQFLDRVDKLSPATRLGFRVLSRASALLPRGRVRGLVQRLAYGGVQRALGGAMRLMWTGMAPIKRDVLDFFWHAGIPLYEAYGMEECGIIATNSPGAHRPGSVGKPLDESTITLAEDGEVLVHREHFGTRGYWKPADDAASMTFLPSGEIATGDIGRFDDEGFLYLVGRKKEIIITSSGQKIHPELLEARLNQHTLVERSIVFGGVDMPYLAAVIVPRVASVEDTIRSHVHSVNMSLGADMQIGRVVFSSEPFTPESGLLTRTLKLNRGAIFQRFEAELRGDEAARSAHASEPDEPLTDTERTVMDVWREVLGRKRIGKHEHFFTAGGDSMRAIQMLHLLAKKLDVRLPLEVLLASATIEALARRIDQHDHGQATRSLLVPLRAEGTRPPLICVHPLNGGVLCYKELADHLGSDQPVYGMRAQGTLEGERPQDSFAAMVAAYAREIQAFQPTGPYWLCGWSLGGLLAIGTARILARQGHTVARVFLIDTWLPLTDLPELSEQERYAYQGFLADWLQDPADIVDMALPELDGLTRDQKNKAVADFMCADGRFRPHLEPVEMKRLLDVHMAVMQAELEFDRAPCEQPVLYVHATRRHSYEEQYDVERVKADDCIVLSMECHHAECLKMPHVVEVAAAIQAAFEPAPALPRPEPRMESVEPVKSVEP